MFRLSPLLFFVLALFSAHVVFGAPSCTKHLDDCVSKCRQKFGLWPSSSTPSNVLPTPAVDADPYNLTTTTVTSSTYNPNASGVPPSDEGNDQLIQQTSTPSPTPTPTPSPTSSTPSSTPSTPSSSSGDVSTWLSAHNVVRAQHGANPLSWSDDLAAKAQQWANGCVFQHSGGSLGPYGGKCLPSEWISWSLMVATQKILPLVPVIIPVKMLLMIGSRKLVSYGMATM